jgi:hypothetical protein
VSLFFLFDRLLEAVRPPPRSDDKEEMGRLPVGGCKWEGTFDDCAIFKNVRRTRTSRRAGNPILVQR